MPGTWSDGEPAEGDDEQRLAPPVHPDDRLWRHPSELAWGVPPPTPPSGTPRIPAGAGPATASPAGRPWGLLVTSGLLGAAVALSTVAFLGGLGTGDPERIVERVGVRTQLADAFTAYSEDTPGVPEVVASVRPSVVGLELPAAASGTGGSGVVLLDDGHIVTNAHVVGDAREVTIVRSDGRAVRGRVVGVDEVTDLAVVEPVRADDELVWTPAVRGPSSDLRVGDPTVVVTGPGAGGSPTVTVAMVASMARWLRTSDGRTLHNLIETDAAVGADTSGGALCDRTGRVVGLATAVAGEGEPGYATTMEDALPTAEALIEDGEIEYAWLGVQGSDLDATQSSLLGLTGPASGVLVVSVVESSPATAAGITAGDVLLAIGDERIGSMSDLVVALRTHHPGDTVTASVRRGGEQLDLTVTLASRD